jgi:acetoin utilization protein AcuB
MRLQDIMERTVDTAAENEPAQQAWQRMRLDGIHHLVVTSGSEVVGVISERDLGGRGGARIREGRSVGELMTRSPVVAAPETTVRQAANLMRGRSIGCLPVIKDGRLAGIVTVTDLLELLGRGAERPIDHSRRWVMAGRGPRRKPYAARRA